MKQIKSNQNCLNIAVASENNTILININYLYPWMLVIRRITAIVVPSSFTKVTGSCTVNRHISVSFTFTTCNSFSALCAERWVVCTVSTLVTRLCTVNQHVGRVIDTLSS